MSGPIVRAVAAEIEFDLAVEACELPRLRACGALWFIEAFPHANVDVSFRHQDAMLADWKVPLP